MGPLAGSHNVVKTSCLRHHAYGPLPKHLMYMTHLTGCSKSSSDWLKFYRMSGRHVCHVL